MRYLFPLLLLLIASCSKETTRIRLVNATSFNLETAMLSFGGTPEVIGFLAAGEDTPYFRFDGADDCNREFTGQLQSFGAIESNNIICGEPAPIAPGKYSLTIAFEQFTNINGQLENGVFLRLRED